MVGRVGLRVVVVVVVVAVVVVVVVVVEVGGVAWREGVSVSVVAVSVTKAMEGLGREGAVIGGE